MARRLSNRVVHGGLVAVAVCAAGLAGPAVTAASGATFSVNPTQIFLSQQAPSALLTVRNDSDQPLRFQITAFAWDQSPTGEIRLAATDDVVFFPALVALEPREERRIRVGTVAGAAAQERTYRIFVEELPAPAGGGEDVAVRVLTKMGIPIFVRPGRETASATLHELAAQDGSFVFEVANTGTVHFVPEAMTVRGLGATGQPVFEESVSAWYILAGGRRIFDLTLPAAECARVRSLVVEAGLGSSRLSEALETPGGVCAQ